MIPIIDAYGKAICEGVVFDDGLSGSQVCECFSTLKLHEIKDLDNVGLDDLMNVPCMTLRSVIAVLLFAQHHDIKILRGSRKTSL